MYNTQEPKRRRKKFCVTFMAKFPILYILYVYNGNNLKIPKMTIIWYFSRENKTVVNFSYIWFHGKNSENSDFYDYVIFSVKIKRLLTFAIFDFTGKIPKIPKMTLFTITLFFPWK